jgi:hypothetical protein
VNKPAKPPKPPKPPSDAVAGGTHWRFETTHGPVHLWMPEDYDPVTAGVVVYVHGLFTDVDGAWADHHLAEQFAKSRKNALFMACEAPKSGDQEPFWESLDGLLQAATSFLRTADELMPQIPDVVVVGHSAAYRTVGLWLGEPIRHLVLVDAMYGYEDEFADWVEASKPSVDGRFTRQLTVVVDDTYRWAEPFIRRFGDVLTRMQIPELEYGFTDAEQRARILYVPSQYGHMELVTEGRTLPVLLRQTALVDLKPPVKRPTLARRTPKE